MKHTNTFRRLMSLLLIAAMLLSMAVVGSVGVFAADDGLALSYNFKYKNAGYAEGQVTLSADSASDYGNYTFYWADDTKALEGYAPITTLNLNKESVNFNFREFTAIPAGATKLIATKSAKTVAGAAAVYDIPADKQFKYADSEKEYNFQTLSDIHFHRDNYDGYKYAADHFTSALNAAELRGAEFVSTCGDNTNYGDNKEYGMFQNTIAYSDFTGPVYEITGNHACYEEVEVDSSTHINALNRFKIGTGLDAGTDKMRSELYYEVTASNGDHHIYMALELVNDKYYPSISDNFTKAQIDWLEGLLNKYKNDGKNIFIYEHAPFTGYGAGDNKVNPHYTAGMTINKELYPQTYRFKELLEANKNIVWFSGHTHIDFKYNYNIDNENGTTAYTVHVPSTASTTTVNTATNGLIYEGKADSAQGYFVDVYADAVVLNGTDLVKNEILPLYTYLIDYSSDKQSNDDYVEEPTTPAPTEPQPTTYEPAAKADVAEVGAGVTVYAINSTKWDAVSTHYWGGSGISDTSWPGAAMTKTGETVNGFDVYSITLDAAPASIIFNNNGQGSQTDDLTFQAGKYYDIKAGTWYDSLSDVPGADPLSTDRYLVGEFNGWSTVANEFKLKAEGEKVGYVELELEAHTTYEFKIFRDNVWTSCKETLHITETSSGLTFSSGVGDNVKITTRDAGTYVFEFGVETSQLTVTYPAASVDPTPSDPTPSDPVPSDPTPSEPTPSDPEPSDPTPSEPETSAPAETDTVKVYFTNNMGWKNAYIYGFYGVAGQTAEKVWPGEYPGTAMTFVETNEFGEDVYYYDVPADIDYIKFSDGDNKGTNERTDNIPNAEFVAGNKGFYLEDKDGKYWPYATYEIETEEPDTTAPATVDEPTEPDTTAPVVEAETVKVYFTNNKGWKNAYIYGFYGVAGQTAEKVWPGEYPGTAMTFVETNEFGEDVYSYDVPADIDYIKFSDGDNKGTNERTDNIPNAEFVAGNKGFYLENKDGKYWPYATYEIETEEPDTTAPASVDEPTEPDTTVPASADEPTEPDTTVPEPETVKVYFSNNKGWKAAYIYGFYGVAGQTAEKVWPCDYPGAEMDFVETNGYGEDVYSYDVPADIDYIKFSDGDNKGTNERTDNIPNAEFVAGNKGFYLEDKDGKYWPYVVYDYVPSESDTTVPSEPVTTVPSQPTQPAVTLLYGDADQNGSVNVKDATAIQKHIADLYLLTDAGYAVSDVDANDSVNVKDVTMIQKFAADLIERFPAEDVVKPTEPTDPTVPTVPTDPVPSTELDKLLGSVGTTLTNERYYASYVAYAGLKKVYFEYKDADVAESEEAAAVAEINAALSSYNTMKKNNPNHTPLYTAPKPGTYVIHGDLTGTGTWTNYEFVPTASNSKIGTFTKDLAAGTYKFVINESGTDNWFKNGKTINDTCKDLIYTTSGADTTLVATGGTYTFQFNSSTKALTITKK